MDEWEFVDANLIVRLLTGDVPEQLNRIDRYLLSADAGGRTAALLPITISEVVFVLRGRVYQRSHEEITAALEALLSLPISIVDRDVVTRAMGIFRDHHDDWNDSLLAAYALLRGSGRVVSFDRGLARIPGVTRIEPG